MKVASFDGDSYGDNWMEGAALFKRGNYWYVLASYGAPHKNYTIRMGRSSSPTGPFFDKPGVILIERNESGTYGNSILLGDEGMQLLPGHPHLWTEENQTYLGYDFRRDRSEDANWMGIRKVEWVEDWPTIYSAIELVVTAEDLERLPHSKMSLRFRNSGQTDSALAIDLITLVTQ